MDSRSIAIVDDAYGGVDGFVQALLADENDVALDDALPMTVRAEAAGLPLSVFAQVVRSREFITLLRAGLVRREFGLQVEAEHIQQVAKVARGEQRRVMSARGTFGDVDQAPTDVIAAGKYLNELRGTPVERTPQSAGVSFNINIENALVSVEVEHDSSALGEVDHRHSARRAGDLPPAGVLGRSGQAVREQLGSGTANFDRELGVIYGPDSEQEAYDHEVAERTRKYQERRTSSESQDPDSLAGLEFSLT